MIDEQGEEPFPKVASPKDGALPPGVPLYAWVAFKNNPNGERGHTAFSVRAHMRFTATDDVRLKTEGYGKWVKSGRPSVFGILDECCETVDLEVSGFPRILHVAQKRPNIRRCVVRDRTQLRQLNASTYLVEITLSGEGFKPQLFRFFLFNPPDGFDFQKSPT